MDDIAWVVVIDTRDSIPDPNKQLMIVLLLQLNATVFGIDEGKQMENQCLGITVSIRKKDCRGKIICKLGFLGCDILGAGIETGKLDEVAVDLAGLKEEFIWPGGGNSFIRVIREK